MGRLPRRTRTNLAAATTPDGHLRGRRRDGSRQARRLLGGAGLIARVGDEPAGAVWVSQFRDDEWHRALLDDRDVVKLRTQTDTSFQLARRGGTQPISERLPMISASLLMAKWTIRRMRTTPSVFSRGVWA